MDKKQAAQACESMFRYGNETRLGELADPFSVFEVFFEWLTTDEGGAFLAKVVLDAPFFDLANDGIVFGTLGQTLAETASKKENGE